MNNFGKSTRTKLIATFSLGWVKFWFAHLCESVSLMGIAFIVYFPLMVKMDEKNELHIIEAIGYLPLLSFGGGIGLLMSFVMTNIENDHSRRLGSPPCEDVGKCVRSLKRERYAIAFWSSSIGIVFWLLRFLWRLVF